MENRSPLKLALRLLTLAGLNPRQPNSPIKWLTSFCVVTTAPLVLIKAFTNMDDLDVLAPTFESMMSYYQISIRLLAFLISKKQLLNLLQAMDEKFWPTETHRDQQFAQGVQKLSQMFKWCCWACLFVGGFGCVCFAVKPLFKTGEKQLPFSSWFPEDSTLPYYEILYLVHIYLLFMATTVAVGFDVYYVAVILRYTIQFMLLRYELECLVGDDDKETEGKIKIYVDYHNFLITQMEKFLKACSFLLLNQYFAFIITLCMELYIIIEISNDYSKLLTSFIYVCFLTLQAATICIPPTILEDETSKISTSIYFSKWYNSTTLGKTILLALTNAHLPIRFDAGGLFAMNVQCLKNILSAGFSFYTLMKNRKRQAFRAE